MGDVTIAGFFTLAGVLVGAWLTMLVADRTSSRDARKRFRQLIRGYVDRFDSIETKQAPHGVLIKLHQESLPDISKASLDIIEDIYRWHHSGFKATRRRYISLTYGDIETRRNEATNMAGPIMGVHDITEGKRKIIELLTEMISYSK
jgi:gas vesicle protein